MTGLDQGEGVRHLASRDVVTREIGGEVLLIPVAAGIADVRSLYVLNETAAYLWDRLRSGATQAELIDGLLDAYETTREVAQRDVDVFCSLLVEGGLLSPESVGASGRKQMA